jgi:sugar/nucleoside kinase (ribokinase family)
VLSEHERASCAELISAAGEQGATVAITAGADPIEILSPGGKVVRVAVPAIERPRDDLGAGDVFAAAFFVALAEGGVPAHAVAFANAAAAVRVNGVGADAIGDRAAVQERLLQGAATSG